jgi:hypothetical protein
VLSIRGVLLKKKAWHVVLLPSQNLFLKTGKSKLRQMLLFCGSIDDLGHVALLQSYRKQWEMIFHGPAIEKYVSAKSSCVGATCCPFSSSETLISHFCV